MTVLKPVRLLWTVAVLATFPLLSAIAQTQSPAPPATSPPPAATKPETTMPPAQRPAKDTPDNNRYEFPGRLGLIV